MTLNTREALHAMLTTNTGSHMLDSGGAYGRNWERNASKSGPSAASRPAVWSARTEFVCRAVSTRTRRCARLTVLIWPLSRVLLRLLCTHTIPLRLPPCL